MERRTICYQPNQERTLCNNPNGDAMCGDCRISLNWILNINDQNPQEKLKVFTSNTAICLKRHEHRKSFATVKTGIFTTSSNPSSPKQP